MPYTVDQMNEINERKRQYEKRGYPEKAAALQVQAENDTPFDELLGTPEDLQEEVDSLPEPPRSGAGSGADQWRSFAKTISDMDPEVIDTMSRDEIINVLEEAELIDVNDPTGDNG